MNENKILREKARVLGYKKVAPFARDINSCLSEETWARMLKRDEKVDLRTLLIMTAELGLSTAVLRSLLLVRGEKIIADLVSPITTADQQFLEKFKKLRNNTRRVKVVMDLLDLLAVGVHGGW